MSNAERYLRVRVIMNAKLARQLQSAGRRKLKFTRERKTISTATVDFSRFPTRSMTAVAIPSSRARAMLIKFYRLHSVTVEKCIRAIFISYISFSFVTKSRAEIIRSCIFLLLSLSIQVLLCSDANVIVAASLTI